MYRIRIRGRLDPCWSERLGGMTVTVTGGRNAVETTLLEGQLLDQADLDQDETEPECREVGEDAPAAGHLEVAKQDPNRPS